MRIVIDRLTVSVVITCVVPLVLVGCSANSGIIDLGNGSFMISKQAATGFHGIGGIKSDAIQEAADHCKKTGLGADIVEMEESEPPYVLGNFPQIDVEFKCVGESTE